MDESETLKRVELKNDEKESSLEPAVLMALDEQYNLELLEQDSFAKECIYVRYRPGENKKTIECKKYLINARLHTRAIVFCGYLLVARLLSGCL
jgi:hypothetical protein